MAMFGTVPWYWWVGFNVFVLAMLALDLGVFHRKSHVVGLREAIGWSIAWITLALLFNLGLWMGWFGDYEAHERSRIALEFLTGYLVEKSLSVDNIFVFMLIFSYFAVPQKYEHKVLFYGILGALVFRAAFIFGGLWVIEKFEWTIYIFGGFLVLTGIKMGLTKEKEIHPERNPVLRIVRSVFPVSANYDGDRFWTRIDHRIHATPMFLVLVIVESTDIVFAADSIPAIIAITKDPFIVYTSNVFAILGLRALYFALAHFMRMFRFLSFGLSVLLVFIGGKMLVAAAFHKHMPIGASLGVIGGIVGLSVLLSVLIPAKQTSLPDDKPKGPAED